MCRHYVNNADLMPLETLSPARFHKYKAKQSRDWHCIKTIIDQLVPFQMRTTYENVVSFIFHHFARKINATLLLYFIRFIQHNKTSTVSDIYFRKIQFQSWCQLIVLSKRATGKLKRKELRPNEHGFSGLWARPQLAVNKGRSPWNTSRQGSE